MIKKIAYILSVVAAMATIAIGLHSMSKPYSIAAFVIVSWAASPYGLLVLIIKATRSDSAIIGAFILSILATIFGLGLIIDSMYIHLDAQGGLIFLFGPLWQWVGIIALSLPVLFLNRFRNA